MGIKYHAQMTVFAYDFFLRNNMFALKNGGFLRFFVAFGPSVARFVGGTGWGLAFCGAVRCSVCANGKFSGFC